MKTEMKMEKRNFKGMCKQAGYWTLVLALFCNLGVALTSGDDDQQNPKAWYEDKDSLRADLERSIIDAKSPDESKVSHTLVAINPDDPAQDWTVIDGKKMVLVAAFMNEKGAAFYESEDTFRTQKQTGIWVALPCNWKQRSAEFVGLDSVAAQVRMAQMLGLGVDCNYDRVVEFYADPAGMFRPAFDPDITTTTVGLTFPEYADENYTVGETHFREWFAYNLSMAYEPPYALPWTQLGYTYDWHRGAPREGLSEFIVSYNTLAKVKSRKGAWTFIQSILK